jgi:hypothetical protein
MEAEVFGAGHAGGADIAGVAAEGGEADRRPFGEKGEGTFPDFSTDPLQEPSADRVALPAEGHGAAEEDDRGVEGVEEGGDADAEPAGKLRERRVGASPQLEDCTLVVGDAADRGDIAAYLLEQLEVLDEVHGLGSVHGRTLLPQTAGEFAAKEVDRRDILVPEIHRTGSYKVQVKLHPEVVAEVNLEVVSH